MVTETQYKVFKSVYDEEDARLAELVTRAKVYLSVITFVLGSFFLRLDLIAATAKAIVISVVPLGVAGGFLFGALLLSILSLRILSYEGVCDLEEVVSEFGKEPPTDSDFLDDRVVDLAVAAKHNSKQNDKRADCLHWAGIFLVVGFGAFILFLVLAITDVLT